MTRLVVAGADDVAVALAELPDADVLEVWLDLSRSADRSLEAEEDLATAVRMAFGEHGWESVGSYSRYVAHGQGRLMTFLRDVEIVAWSGSAEGVGAALRALWRKGVVGTEAISMGTYIVVARRDAPFARRILAEAVAETPGIALVEQD